VEAFPVSQYVLRKTLIVPSNTNLRPALENVGKIFTTTNQLKTSESIPTTLLFVLPEGVWLKRTPTVQQITSDKWQALQEWWHADDYSRFVFEVV
jgi:hypothetical protein